MVCVLQGGPSVCKYLGIKELRPQFEQSNGRHLQIPTAAPAHSNLYTAAYNKQFTFLRTHRQVLAARARDLVVGPDGRRNFQSYEDWQQVRRQTSRLIGCGWILFPPWFML